MDFELIKKLLPGEVNEFYIRNEIRADGRQLGHHRGFAVTRNVSNNYDESDDLKWASNSVKLG